MTHEICQICFNSYIHIDTLCSVCNKMICINCYIETSNIVNDEKEHIIKNKCSFCRKEHTKEMNNRIKNKMITSLVLKNKMLENSEKYYKKMADNLAIIVKESYKMVLEKIIEDFKNKNRKSVKLEELLLYIP